MDYLLVGLLLLALMLSAGTAYILVGLVRRYGRLESVVHARVLKSLEAMERQWSQERATLQYKRKEKQDSRTYLQVLESTSGLQALKPIKELADLGPKSRPFADDLLERLQAERSSVVRIYLIEAITRIGDTEHLRKAIVAGLEDPDIAIRSHCANLAGDSRFDCEAIRDRLVKLTGDAHFAVQHCSTRALSQLGRNSKSPDASHQEHFGYVLVKAISSNLTHIQELTRSKHWERYPRGAGVLDASLIQGRYDVLLKVGGRDQYCFDEFVMNEIQTLPWVQSTHTLCVISLPCLRHWIRRKYAQQPLTYNASSWVLVTAPSAVSGLIVLALRALPEFSAVQEAAAVFGPAEVVLNLACDSLQELDSIVKRLPEIPYVQSTESLRVFEPANRNHVRWREQPVVLYKSYEVD